MSNRVVNLRFMCCGYKFDAAIDCDWKLHAYGMDEVERQKETPIELFNCDKPEWDIRMCYYKEEGREVTNGQQNPRLSLVNTLCDMEFIKKETRKWVREMRKEGMV